jgi:hypothetical protein
MWITHDPWYEIEIKKIKFQMRDLVKKKQQCSIKKPELIWINSQGNLVERKLKKWQSSMINNLILNDKIKKKSMSWEKSPGKNIRVIRINSTNEIEIKKNRLIKKRASKKNQS